MTLKLTAKRRGGENVSGPVFQTVAGERLEPILKARISRPAEGMGFADGLVYPPLPLSQILSLTYSNAFHTQCIALKADITVDLPK